MCVYGSIKQRLIFLGHKKTYCCCGFAILTMFFLCRLMEKMSLKALWKNLTNFIQIWVLHMSPAFLASKVNLFENKLTTDLHLKPTDTHQYLDYTSSYPEHTKNLIVYSQTLRLRRICYFETDFLNIRMKWNHGCSREATQKIWLTTIWNKLNLSTTILMVNIILKKVFRW